MSREILVRGKDALSAARALGERRVYVIAGTPKGHPQTHHIVEMTVSDMPEWDALMAALESAAPRPHLPKCQLNADHEGLCSTFKPAAAAPATGAERDVQWHFRGCSQQTGHEGECVITTGSAAPRPGPHPERVAEAVRHIDMLMAVWTCGDDETATAWNTVRAALEKGAADDGQG